MLSLTISFIGFVGPNAHIFIRMLLEEVKENQKAEAKESEERHLGK